MSLLDPYEGWGGFDILEGPCCDELTCDVRELWPYQNETIDDMKARLKAKYSWQQQRQGGNLW